MKIDTSETQYILSRGGSSWTIELENGENVLPCSEYIYLAMMIKTRRTLRVGYSREELMLKDITKYSGARMYQNIKKNNSYDTIVNSIYGAESW